ncbi:MAG TPA: hypothetical protein HA262_03395 [Methanosarcina sp.]|nr:hypothetical protein [Methanosarcina sp.]
MKIRIKTFAQIKEILGADSFLECQDDPSIRKFLKALQESRKIRRPAFFQGRGPAQ